MKKLNIVMKNNFFALLIIGMPFFALKMHSQASMVVNLAQDWDGVDVTASAVIMGDRVYFAARDVPTNFELWTSDGTEDGTYMVRDIWPGGFGSNPGYFTVLGDILYFRANDGTHGYELWRSDGTEEGTYLVKDINPGGNQSHGLDDFSGPYVIFPSETHGKVFFRASDDVHGLEVWKSDGTEEGTQLIKNLYTGVEGGGGRYFAELDGIIYYTARSGTTDDHTGEELHRTDGTEEGTWLVRDIQPGTSNSGVRFTTAVGGNLYFVAFDDFLGTELFVSDGTEAGTQVVRDILPGFAGAFSIYSGSRRPSLIPFGDRLIFTASRDQQKMSLWITNGTFAGTTMIREFDHTGQFAHLIAWTELDGKIFFLIQSDDQNSGLWESNGTPGGTRKLVDFDIPHTPFPSDPVPASLTSFDGKLFIWGNHESAGDAIYMSDGTEEGTVKIADATQAVFFGATQDRLFFSAVTPEHGRELWVYLGDTTSSVHAPEYLPAFNVYPNPARDRITVTAADADPASVRRIILYDILGRPVASWPAAGELPLPAVLTPGHYTLEIRTAGGTVVHPLIIRKSD